MNKLIDLLTCLLLILLDIIVFAIGFTLVDRLHQWLLSI